MQALSQGPVHTKSQTHTNWLIYLLLSVCVYWVVYVYMLVWSDRSLFKGSNKPIQHIQFAFPAERGPSEKDMKRDREKERGRERDGKLVLQTSFTWKGCDVIAIIDQFRYSKRNYFFWLNYHELCRTEGLDPNIEQGEYNFACHCVNKKQNKKTTSFFKAV